MEKIDKKRLKLIMLTSMIALYTIGCNSKKDTAQIVYHESMEGISNSVEEANHQGEFDASGDYRDGMRNNSPFLIDESISWNRSYTDSYNNKYDELEFTIEQFNEGYNDGNEQGYNDAINNLEKNIDSYDEARIANYILGYKQGYENGYSEGLESEDKLEKIHKKIYR